MRDQIDRAAEMAADWWAKRLETGDREKFRAELKTRVEARLRERGNCWLRCDYDPQDDLLEAVRAAGIKCRGCLYSAEGILPMKHTLHVTPTRMRPKEGYGYWTDEIPVPE